MKIYSKKSPKKITFNFLFLFILFSTFSVSSLWSNSTGDIRLATNHIENIAADTSIIDFPQDATISYDDECIWNLIITETEGAIFSGVNRGTPIHLPATGDESFQLSITYDVINWYAWDGEYAGFNIPRQTEDDGESGNFVESSERPAIFIIDGVVSIDRSNNIRALCPDGTGGLTTGDDSNLPDSTDTQNPDLNNGRWDYTQIIKVYDNISPLIVVNEFGGVTDACPNLEPRQFCTQAGVEVMVNIPFSASDLHIILGLTEDSPVSIVSAQLDLFSLDLNGDGTINENEFIPETGDDGNIMANITDNGDGAYVFSRACPAIPHEMRETTYHAIRIVLEDIYGNQTTKIIDFDVIEQRGPNALDGINGLASAYSLHQNQPNPFSNKTTITFHTPIASEISIDFRDIRGRLLYTNTGHYLPGLNKIQLTKSMLKGVSGIVTYTLTSGVFITTKKMIVVE